MLPEWLNPPAPTYTGTVRTVQQDWGEVTRGEKRREERGWKGESKRLLATLELVKAYPGRLISELQPYTSENLNWMLRNLRRAGKVRVEGERGEYRYWPCDERGA